MMDGYFIMFASGIILGTIFYAIMDVVASLLKYLRLKRKKYAEKPTKPEGDVLK